MKKVLKVKFEYLAEAGLLQGIRTSNAGLHRTSEAQHNQKGSTE